MCHACEIHGHYRSDGPKGSRARVGVRGGPSRGGGRSGSRGVDRTYDPRPPDLPTDDWAMDAQEWSDHTRDIIEPVNRGDVSKFLVDSGAS